MAILLAGAAGFLVSQRRAPVYAAAATVQVARADGLAAPASPAATDVLAAQQLAQTYSVLLTAAPVREQTVKDLGFSAAQRSTIGSVSATARHGTQLIDVTVRGSDAALAAQFANALGPTFAQQVRQQDATQRTAAGAALSQQIAIAQQSIDAKATEVAGLSAPQAGTGNSAVVASAADASPALRTAQGDLAQLQTNLAALQQSLASQTLAAANPAEIVALAVPAGATNSPDLRPTLVAIALGGAIGLLLAGIAVALLERRDDKVRSAADVRAAAGVPALGSIVRRAPSDLRGADPADSPPPGSFLRAVESDSPIAESYRSLRANLYAAGYGGALGRLLVTSARGGEGASNIASNLALSLARSGRRVVLVDADLQRATVSRLFGAPNTGGLAALLAGQETDAAMAVCPTGIDNLLVLPSGASGADPNDLLASPRLSTVLSALQSAADILVVDGPPVLSSAGAAALAAHVDGVLLVVEAGRTRGSQLRDAVDALERVHATVWGIALNKLPGAVKTSKRPTAATRGSHREGPAAVVVAEP